MGSSAGSCVTCRGPWKLLGFDSGSPGLDTAKPRNIAKEQERRALARGIPVVGVCSLDAIAIEQSDYTVAIDARRKEIYWARYENGSRADGPHVSKPDQVDGFIFDVFPDMNKLVSLSAHQNVTEPMYLRRPDAVPTAERT